MILQLIQLHTDIAKGNGYVENIPMMIKDIMTILTNVIDVDELLIMRKEFVRVVERGCIRSKNNYVRFMGV